jgi:hypothetical protein
MARSISTANSRAPTPAFSDSPDLSQVWSAARSAGSTPGAGDDSARSSGRSKLGARSCGSARGLATSGVARRTASGGRGGDALVMSASSSGIGGPNSGNSSRGAGAGAERGSSATAAGDIGRTASRAACGPGPPNIRSRSVPTSGLWLACCQSRPASISERSSNASVVSVSRRIVKSGSGTGAEREKS